MGMVNPIVDYEMRSPLFNDVGTRCLINILYSPMPLQTKAG